MTHQTRHRLARDAGHGFLHQSRCVFAPKAEQLMKHDAGQRLLFQCSRRGERIRHVTHQGRAEAAKLANRFVDR